MEARPKGCLEAEGGAGGGSYRVPDPELALEAKIRRAVEFKAEGNHCYKQKKSREAIGKQVSLGARRSSWRRLTEEQQALVEGTQIEC